MVGFEVGGLVFCGPGHSRLPGALTEQSVALCQEPNPHVFSRMTNKVLIKTSRYVSESTKTISDFDLRLRINNLSSSSTAPRPPETPRLLVSRLAIRPL